MKTREEIARFIERTMHWSYNSYFCPKKEAHHYGWCELKDVMDFIFDGPPKTKEEELTPLAY